MSPEWRTLLFTFSIIRYDDNGDLSNALPNIFGSLLDILISDLFAVVVDSAISYKSSVLAFLAVIVTLSFLFYLILYSRYYSTFYS